MSAAIKLRNFNYDRPGIIVRFDPFDVRALENLNEQNAQNLKYGMWRLRHDAETEARMLEYHNEINAMDMMGKIVRFQRVSGRDITGSSLGPVVAVQDGKKGH